MADVWLVIGHANNLLGRVDEAIANLERARAANVRLWYIHLELAAAYGLAGRIQDAEQALAEHLRLRPEFSSIAAIRAHIPTQENTRPIGRWRSAPSLSACEGRVPENPEAGSGSRRGADWPAGRGRPTAPPARVPQVIWAPCCPDLDRAGRLARVHEQVVALAAAEPDLL